MKRVKQNYKQLITSEKMLSHKTLKTIKIKMINMNNYRLKSSKIINHQINKKKTVYNKKEELAKIFKYTNKKVNN